jgi:hypothetical protein
MKKIRSKKSLDTVPLSDIKKITSFTLYILYPVVKNHRDKKMERKRELVQNTAEKEGANTEDLPLREVLIRVWCSYSAELSQLVWGHILEIGEYYSTAATAFGGGGGRASSCVTLQRKFHLCISFLGIALPRSQFPH